MLRALSMRDYFGKNYDEFLTLKKYLSIMKTGKSAKKSTVVSKQIVLRSVTDQRFCALVARKQMIDHEKSTFPAVISAFNELERKTGYNWRKDWVVSRGAKNPNITNKKTGQIIRFISFDRPESLAGLQMEDPRYYWGMLWFEEPMQIADTSKTKNDDLKQQEQERNYDIMISSAFRGKLPPNAHREIVLTFNDWSDGDFWIIRKWIKPYLSEDEDILEYFGQQMVYDPNFEDGKGIYVMVASGGINEFHDADYLKFIKEIKKNDREFYKAIWLGTNATMTGNAYGKANINNIKRKIDFKLIDEWYVGIDYAASKDYLVVLLIGHNPNTYDYQVVDGWRYNRGKEKIPMPEPQMIEAIWTKMIEWRNKYAFQNYDDKTEIHIDSKDVTVLNFLREQYWELSNGVRLDFLNPAPAAKFKSQRSWNRIMVTRYLMGAGKFRVAPHLNWLVDEYKVRTFLKDGSIKDGGDDGPQAQEYATSSSLSKMLPKQAYNNILQAGKEYAVEQYNKQNGN